MPRVLVDGEIVRAEVLPRQRAHQDTPQGCEGAAGNLSIHVVGSHIIVGTSRIRAATSQAETRAAIHIRHSDFYGARARA